MHISKLAHRRRMLNMSQIELSKKTGLTQSMISRIERGDIKFSNMTVANAVSLAKGLDTTVEELYDECKEEQK